MYIILDTGDVVIPKLDALGVKLETLLAAVQQLAQKGDLMATTLDQAIKDHTAQVAQNTQVEASAVTLIQGIAAQLTAAAGDPAAVESLAAQLKGSADALAAAITANTPATPAA